MADSPANAARARTLDRLATEPFDVLVVGGGITGCGVARDAALRGLRVALVEQEDFASGTSSRSSRLVHGGLRYLEHGQLHLVFESSAERRRLMRIAPHLVRPLEFLWPVYQGARVPRWKLEAGLALYDALALFRNVAMHRPLSRRQVLAREPQLRRDGLAGGARYFDASTDDARLTLANALDAVSLGAAVANHVELVALETTNGRAVGGRVVDRIGGRSIDVRARVVVNATGPWTDRLRRLEGDDTHPAVRGSKGTHIEVPRTRIGNHGALTLLSGVDGRVMFVLPAGHNSIVGTTDAYTDVAPELVQASSEEVDYLLRSANGYFPEAQLTTADVISAWAGIRPLASSAERDPVGASREHVIARGAGAVISVTGGKLTTYRLMAAEVVSAVERALSRPAAPVRTDRRPLPGGQLASLEQEELRARTATAADDVATHLVWTYGTGWEPVWRQISRDAASSQRLAPDLPYTMGELRYAVAHEMACTLEDLLCRRTRLAFEVRDHGLAVAPAVADAVAADLGWTSTECADAVAGYERAVDRLLTIAAAPAITYSGAPSTS